MRKGELSIKNHEDATQNNKNILIYSVPYDVLRLIFEYLNVRDLANAAMVCRSWLEAANDEKLTRLRPRFIYQFFNENNDSLNHLIKNLRIKPYPFCFCFVTTIPNTYYDISYIEDQFFHHSLSKYSDIAFFFGKANTTKKMQRIPKQICVFLPRISNVTITSFSLDHPIQSMQNTTDQKMMRTIFNHKTSMPNHETSTCFLIFCNDQNYKIVELWESMMRRSIGNEIIVTYLCHNLYHNCDGTSYLMHQPRIYLGSFNKGRKKTRAYRHIPYCIMITGSIQTWVTILKKECNTEERIEARLKLFKNEVKLKKHSLGFMFRSLYRDKMYGKANETNVESIIFKRLFPKVPLVGINNFFKFSLSNICDKLNEEKNIQVEHKSERPELCCCSTKFLILTYG